MRILLIILICMVVTSPAYAGLSRAIQSAVDSAYVSGTDTSILFFWGLENNSITTLGGAGVDYPTGKVGTNPDGSPTINTTNYVVGTHALAVNTGGYRYTQFAVSSADIVSGTEGNIGFWIRVHAVDAADCFIARVRNANDSNEIQMFLNHAGTIKVIWKQGGASVTTTGATVLSLDTWYWVEYRYSSSTPYRRLFVGTGVSDPETPDAESTAAFAGWTDQTKLQIGHTAGISGLDYTLDNIIIRNSPSSLFSLRNSTGSPR